MLAIRDGGRWEILSVDVADTESEATYHDLFRRLKQRGLGGVRLVTALCMEQPEEWLSGRCYLAMHDLRASAGAEHPGTG